MAKKFKFSTQDSDLAPFVGIATKFKTLLKGRMKIIWDIFSYPSDVMGKVSTSSTNSSQKFENTTIFQFTCRVIILNTNISGAFYGGDIINFRGKTVALACGPNGADITFDAGQTWQSISTNNLWVSDFTESGKAWLAGTQGKILKLELQ